MINIEGDVVLETSRARTCERIIVAISSANCAWVISPSARRDCNVERSRSSSALLGTNPNVALLHDNHKREERGERERKKERCVHARVRGRVHTREKTHAPHQQHTHLAPPTIIAPSPLTRAASETPDTVSPQCGAKTIIIKMCH